jgi:Rhs element Vgr protein
VSALPITRSTEVVTLAVLVNGLQLPTAIPILGAEVVTQANRVPYARLRIGDGDSALGDFSRSSGSLFVPGNRIVLNAGYQGETAQVFGGVILNQRIMVRAGSSWLEIECRDPVFQMTLARQNRYFEDATDADVVSKLLEAYAGKGVSAGKTAAASVTHPQLLQYQTSDWDFMIARLEAAGLVCFSEGGVLTTVKPSLAGAPVAELAFGDAVLELDAELDARSQTGGVRAAAWDPAAQSLQEVAAADPGWSGNGNLDGTRLSDAAGHQEDVVWHGGSLASDQLQSWADGSLLRARLAAARGRVRCQGVSAVKPGSVLTLARFGDRFNGKVYVTGVRHEFAGNSWTSDCEFGLSRELHAARDDFGTLPAAGLAAPVHGLQVGVVTAIADDPGKEHRVRVRVPIAGVSEDGVWARVATLDAGSKRGTFFRPEKDDEVVLGFFHDDPAQPVILGMLHSSKHEPPLSATSGNDEKAYVSREKLALRFDEKKKAITLETPAKNRLTLSDDDGGIVLEDQNGNRITMNKDGITFESAKNPVTIKAGTEFKAEAKKMSFTSQTTLTAKAQAKAEVSSSGMLTLKGSLVQIN